MPINGMTLLSGATNAATGGTSKAFSVDGQQVKSGIHVADLSVSDFRLRPGITFKSRMPSKKSDGTWVKGKFSATVVIPKLLANGTTVDYPLGRVEIEPVAESTEAEIVAILCYMAQLCFDADTVSFMKTGSLS